MFINLPPELVIKCFSYSDLRSLASACAVSKSWHTLVTKHKDIIYRYAALNHRFIELYSTSLDNVISRFGKNQMAGVQSWKQLCKRLYEIETNWLGVGRGAKYIKHRAAGNNVGRFKIDEENGLIIAIQNGGGLTVSDLFSERLLWALDKEYLFEPAHCEYGNGYMVFDDPFGGKEVWRLSSIAPFGNEEEENSTGNVVENGPTDRQLSASQRMDDKYGTYPGDKGHFVPWVYLIPPKPGRAYRVVFPHLCVVAPDYAYLWDLPSGRLVQTISNIGSKPHGTPPNELGSISYVDFNESYVFICGKNQLRIFDRADKGNLIYSLSTGQIQRVRPYQLEIYESPTKKLNASSSIPWQCKIKPLDSDWLLPKHFMAVHVWENYLALLTADARLIVVRDYERVIRENLRFGRVENTMILNLSVYDGIGPDQQEARYLAFDYGKIGVATLSGIFVIHVDTDYYSVDFAELRKGPDYSPPWPYRFGAFPMLEDMYAASSVTCLQIVRHELLVTMVEEVDEDFDPHFDEIVQYVVGYGMLSTFNGTAGTSSVALPGWGWA